MLKYQCNKCEIQKEFSKVVMKVENGKVINVGTECPKCGKYMQEIAKEFNGFPQLRRTEPSLSKRQDRMWKETKEKLTS
jgi:TusA-related sulfurtransferase